MWKIDFLLIFLSFLNFSNCDLFASLNDLEKLIETENLLIGKLENFIASHERVLEYLKGKLSDYKNEHRTMMEDSQSYLSNPLNSFLLIKRMVTVRDTFLDPIELKNAEFHDDLEVFESKNPYPNENQDLQGAAMGISRLQKIYLLETSDLAQGIIDGTKYRDPLSSSDCYYIGRLLNNYNEFNQALEWLNESLKIHDDIKDPMEVTKMDINHEVLIAYNGTGQLEKARDYGEKLMQIDPENRFVTDMLNEINRNYAAYENGTLEIIGESKPTRENILHAKSCRNELERDPKLISQLKCRYINNTTAFTKLAPIKLEEANLDPFVGIFHGVMYDRDIEAIKQLSRTHFQRSKTYSDNAKGKNHESYYRVSKVAWLDDHLNEHIKKVTLRTEDMTGLSMETVESLQVQNYGVGGHYDCHVDYLRENKNPDQGDRVATVLYYLTDVAKGGATVFPYLRIHVAPEKGKAVFWYNIAACGNVEWMTRHSSCPVLVGNKWASNKWIHEYGQIFRRPCGLKPKISKEDYTPFYVDK